MGYAVLWISFAVVAATVARLKGRKMVQWLLYGLLLSPVAVVHALFARPVKSTAKRDSHVCPNCARQIRAESRVCRHCRQSLPEDWAATWGRAS